LGCALHKTPGFISGRVVALRNTLVILFFSVCLFLGSGKTFAQVGNNVTIDFRPTTLGIIYGLAEVEDLQEGESANIFGFGIGLQFERQLSDYFSMAGRFAYFGFGLRISAIEDNDKIEGGASFSSLSLEYHTRYYPFKGTFFMDCMLGYAFMSGIFSAGIVYTDHEEKEKSDSILFSVTRAYVKYGVKLGWRIRFGSNSGFTLEPAFGWNIGIGLGDSLGTKLSMQYNEISSIDGEGMDTMFYFFEKFVLIGGPRMTLAFGYSF